MPQIFVVEEKDIGATVPGWYVRETFDTEQQRQQWYELARR